MKKRIIFNEDSKRFEIGDSDLHCGDCFEVLDGTEWIECRIEYSHDKADFYLILFRDGQRVGTAPVTKYQWARLSK